MKKDIFEQIIKKGLRASSGDNLQNFQIFPSLDYQSFFLYIDMRKPEILDYHHISSYISSGMFLKNIELASQHFGYTANITYCLDEKKGKIAEVGFIHDRTKNIQDNHQDLFYMIDKRNCNRFPYTGKKLSMSLMSEILSLSSTDVQFHHIDSSDSFYKNVGKSLYIGETHRYACNECNRDFLSNIRFSDQEAKITGDGLDNRLLGLPIGLRYILPKLLQYPLLMKWIQKCGFHKPIAYLVSKHLLTSSQGVIAVSIADMSAESYVKLGMQVQNAWLLITTQGGSLQPFAPIPFFHYMIDHGADGLFPQKTQHDIRREYDNLKTYFHIDSHRTISMVFRFGIPKQQKIKSYRKQLSQVIHDK